MKRKKFINKRKNILKIFNSIDFSKEIYRVKFTKKEIKIIEISKKIKLKKRQTISLINLYKKCLLDGDFDKFINHKHSQKNPWNKIDPNELEHYINMYKEKQEFYSSADIGCLYYPSEFINDLEELGELKHSESTIRKTLKNKCILSPLAKRKTKRKYKKNPQSITDEFIIEQNKKALNYDVKKHTSKFLTPFGKKVEGDACFFDPCGLGFNVATGALMDSSGFMLCADCELEETNPLYYSLFGRMFAKYGLPDTFVIDCRATFYSPEGREKTDFTKALESKGIEVICSSNPKAKPHVERGWNTLQNWYKFQIIKRNIKTYHEYKYFCQNVLPDLYNKRFKKDIYKEVNKNAFRYIHPDDIKFIFEKTFNRKITKTGNIKIDNEIYKAIDEKGNKIKLYSESVVVHKNLLDNSMFIRSSTSKYELIKDDIQLSKIDESKDKIISILREEIFEKNKKISYLETRVKKLESFLR